ncbi:hypothetical protein CMO96_00840 [Candidatus Woesebacteria bacterium]|nr:hypothetical protein [Candidatus Woesebacteria bacterium]|tara:strand:- start:525 stop:743 length:219 start_codon:yes stop_codon:yes gene_type:complete
MSVYQIQYELEDTDNHYVKHSRYYHAKDENTAKEMFKETCSAGTLTGYAHPKITEVVLLNEVNAEADAPQAT